jgi:hypothetical protein
MTENMVLDITAPKGVEIIIKRDSSVIWVNTENGCVLRICQIPQLIVRDERNVEEKQGVKEQ